MDVSETLGELISTIEAANAKLTTIKDELSATIRKSDLVDDAEMSIILAASKLKRLKIICLAEKTGTQLPEAQGN
jgi:hypothetical protein